MEHKELEMWQVHLQQQQKIIELLEEIKNAKNATTTRTAV